MFIPELDSGIEKIANEDIIETIDSISIQTDGVDDIISILGLLYANLHESI